MAVSMPSQSISWFVLLLKDTPAEMNDLNLTWHCLLDTVNFCYFLFLYNIHCWINLPWCQLFCFLVLKLNAIWYSVLQNHSNLFLCFINRKPNIYLNVLSLCFFILKCVTDAQAKRQCWRVHLFKKLHSCLPLWL